MVTYAAQPSPSNNETLYPWRAQTGPQLTAIQRHLIDPKLFYGGAVGGGKSDYLLGDFAQDVPSPWGRIGAAILFRKTYASSKTSSAAASRSIPLVPGCKWSVQDSLWSWPNGATLKMRYSSPLPMDALLGHAYTWIGWDAAAQLAGHGRLSR